jgi:putative FmdB family regulatory protein
MPLYDAKCEKHGRFEVVRPMAEVDNPVPCPICEQPSPIVFSPKGTQTMIRRRFLNGVRKEDVW